MDVKQAVLGRRSIRKYKSQAVKEQDVRDILEAAIYAPSGVNMQPWHFVAICSQNAMERLKVLMGKTYENFLPTLQTRFAKNPEVIEQTKYFLSNLGGAPVCVLAFLLKHPDADPLYKETFTHTQGISAGIENMLLVAFEKGLGSCWMTAPIVAGLGEDIRKEFAPEHGQLIAAVAIGYPDESPKAPPRREGRYVII